MCAVFEFSRSPLQNASAQEVRAIFRPNYESENEVQAFGVVFSINNSNYLI